LHPCAGIPGAGVLLWLLISEGVVKARVALGTFLWLLVISVGHIQFNVGWARTGDFFKGFFVDVQKELQVGFLPVT